MSQPDFLEKIGAGGSYEPWPDPMSIPVVQHKYRTPDGSFPRVTSILKVLGLGAERLQKWTAEVERDACVDAAVETWMSGGVDSPQEFAEAMRRVLGAQYQYKKQMEDAGDLGTSVHAKVCWWHRGQMGVRAEEPSLPEAGELSFMAYQEWWAASGLTAVRVEQPVWHKGWGFAGQIDNVAVDREGRYGIVDLKTSKNLYDRYHLQCAGYLLAGRRWAPLDWAVLVRLPKTLDDPQIQKREPVEVRPLGKLYDRVLTEQELLNDFVMAAQLHHSLLEKKKAA